MRGRGWWSGALVLLALGAAAGNAAAAGWRHVGAVDAVQPRADGVELAAGPSRVRVTAVADGVLRVRLAPDGRFDDRASWAVVAEPAPGRVQVTQDADAVRVATASLVATIRRDGLRVDVALPDGTPLLLDAPDRPMASDGRAVRAWKVLPDDTRVYGLGDKAGPIDRRGRSFVNWNTDAYGWQAQSDPLYKAIPFFITLRRGVATGVFLDNTHRTTFDFGVESAERMSFGADGGALDYYVIAGPEPARVIERYTALTGRTPLPPKWALGFQQSRYSYVPEARAREVARTLREKKIPADAIYLDIDFQQGNAPFTVDRAKFPTFEKMIADFRAIGLRTVLITDLHVKRDPDAGYAPYDSGVREDVFLKNPDGSTYVGKVWPGDSVFPDFTLTRVRTWWGGLYRDFVRTGAAGFWNDMNEPSIFDVPSKTMPLDTVHRLDDGTTTDHREAHNLVGHLNAKATFDGLRTLQPDVRPFVLTRAAYAGTQRYAATWTGDNTSNWHHLGMSAATLLSLGVSGYALAGDDVGGFIGSPDAELITRWYEAGAFNPVFRNHAETGTRSREAWSDDAAHEARRRAAIERRYRLFPYLYTLAEETARTGLPILRPLFLHYPASEAFHGEGRQFLFGRDLLVAPVVVEGVGPHAISLPPGLWYGFDDGAVHVPTEKPLQIEPKPKAAPVFARAGAIVPLQPLVQHTGETPDGPLELRVFRPLDPSVDCGGTLYDDDGESYAYTRGRQLRVRWTCALRDGGFEIASTVEQAGFRPWWNAARVTVYGVAARPASVTRDGRAIAGWTHDAARGALSFDVADARSDWRIVIR